MWWFSYQKKENCSDFPPAFFSLTLQVSVYPFLPVACGCVAFSFLKRILLMCFVTFPRTGNGEQYSTNHHTFHGFPLSEAVFFQEVLVWEIGTKQKRRLCSSLICHRLVKGVVEIIALNPVWEFWFLYRRFPQWQLFSGFTLLFSASPFSYAIIMWEVLSRRIPYEGSGSVCVSLRDTFLTNKPLGKSVHFYILSSL